MTLDTPAAVVLELMTMGQQSAAHLGDLLRAASPASTPHHGQDLAAEILRCCGRVIDALRATGATSARKRKAPQYQDAAAPPPAWSPPPPPPPPSGPPPPKKRAARGAEAVKQVTSGTTVDGFIWRKYGQKEINGQAHPRLYYRCAHKQQHGCNATRRVQRTAAAYEIAYYGEHTCRGAAAADACHTRGGAAPPPTVVDFGSNSWDGDAGGRGSPPAASVSQGGWSSASPSGSSEVGFDAHAHNWEWQQLHDAAAVDTLIGETTPCYAPDPVMEFLDGCLGWESVLNDDQLDFAGLRHHIASFQ